MNVLVSLIALYVLACAILPAAVALRRGLTRREAELVFTFGLLTGWTGYGALAAWMYALLETPESQAMPGIHIIIR
jgi:hypothetical protein